jgi:hypothetical protein
MAAPDDLPKLPVRAAIYLLPDGTVQFGALFEELIPVARAVGGDSPALPRGPVAAEPAVAAAGNADRDTDRAPLAGRR